MDNKNVKENLLKTLKQKEKCADVCKFELEVKFKGHF